MRSALLLDHCVRGDHPLVDLLGHLRVQVFLEDLRSCRVPGRGHQRHGRGVVRCHSRVLGPPPIHQEAVGAVPHRFLHQLGQSCRFAFDLFLAYGLGQVRIESDPLPPDPAHFVADPQIHVHLRFRHRRSPLRSKTGTVDPGHHAPWSLRPRSVCGESEKSTHAAHRIGAAVRLVGLVHRRPSFIRCSQFMATVLSWAALGFSVRSLASLCLLFA